MFFISGLDTGAGAQFSLNIPYPFVTQGANSIQVFENQPLPACGNALPTSNANDLFTISSGLTLTSYGGTPTIGSSSAAIILTLRGQLPAGTLLWFTVHLNYGLKGYDFTKDSSGNAFGAPGTPSFSPLKEVQATQTYTFSYSEPLLTSGTSSSIQSANKFNKG